MAAIMQAGREFTFDSAHYLENYQGPCERMHGHTYKLQVFVRGEVQADGMVMDFKEIKSVVRDHVISRLDHRVLNEIVKQPTAESLAVWIWEELKDRLPLYEVRLWENPTSLVVYRGEGNSDLVLA